MVGYKRVPIEFKKYKLPKMRMLSAPIKEQMEKHRDIKSKLLVLIEKMENPAITKDKIKNEVFKLYLEIK